MRAVGAAWLGFGALVAAALVPVIGVTQPTDDVAASMFRGRCAGCHEPAVGRAPTKEQLSQRTPESIVAALTTGAMRSFSSGLSPDMVRSVAVYLSGKPLAVSGPAPGAQPPDNKCSTNPPIRAAATDWNGYGRTEGSTRYQPNTTINPKTVERLKVKWSFSVAGGRAGQPAVIGDRLFFTTWAGDAYSLDAKTGCVYWRKAIGSPMRSAPLVVHRPGYSPSGWVMYLGDFNRDFRALDAMTGTELWKTNLDTHPLSMLTGGPTIFGDRIYVPISSAEELTGDLASYQCCTFGGKVAALEMKTGKVVWKTAVLDPKPTRKNAQGTQLFGPAGAAIWSQPTVDAKRGQLYVTTGDSYTEVDAPSADAVLAIGLADGKIRWTTQTLRADNFLIGCPRGTNCPLGKLGPDVDYGSSPILFTLKSGKQVVMAGQKSGLVSAMEPETGKTVWQTQVGFGSLFGGIEWGMTADAKALYVAISDGAAPRDKQRAGVYALDPATGKVNWEALAPRVPCGWGAMQCKPAQSAPATVIPGVVFSGGQDGWLRAYDSKDGRTLWMVDTAGRTYDTVNGIKGQKGGALDHEGFVVSGPMLFAISGYNGSTGAYAGNPINVLLAYSIDGK